MKYLLRSLLFWPLLAAPLRAEVPPPERLLPADTLAMVTAPDWPTALAAFQKSPSARLWADPAMQPFRDKFLTGLQKDLLQPLERVLGVRLADYSDLVRGQATLAVLPGSWGDAQEGGPAVTLLLDTKDQQPRLAKLLAALKAKWVEAGKPWKTEPIRGVEFAKIVPDLAELDQLLQQLVPKPAFPEGSDDDHGREEEEEEPRSEPAPAPKAAPPAEWLVGQSDSLLIVGNNAPAIEKLLARQSGGSVPPLAEEAAYRAHHDTLFRQSAYYGWVNVPALVAFLTKPGDAATGSGLTGGFLPPAAQLLPALGLDGLKAAAFGARQSEDGAWLEFRLSVPESERRGVFKLLVPDAADASVPAFVPADAVKFFRWRLNGQKAWAELETILARILPAWSGAAQLILETTGKDKDPNFDLKQSLIGSLGNDLISFEKAPRATTPTDLSSPATLFLLGALDPERWIQGIKMVASLLPPPLNTLSERQFLGRTIYSAAFAPATGLGADPRREPKLHLAASRGYVALTDDAAMLEDYLRSGEHPPPSLKDDPALNQAAQHVGGMNTGLFGFENTAATLRATWEAARANPKQADQMPWPWPSGLGLLRLGGADEAQGPWADVSLLPAFDQVAKYFYFTVFAGASTPEGFAFKVFAPVSPKLRE